MGNSSGKLHEQVVVGYRSKDIANNNNNNNNNHNHNHNHNHHHADNEQAEDELEYQIKTQKLNGYFLELNQLGLVKLTDAICEGKHLRGLHLARNSLSMLPASFGLALFNLCFLDLSFNKFKELPEQLGQLSNLIELKASHNNLDEFPASLCHLSKLENLDLSYNHICELPTQIGDLESLISLSLEKNLVSFLPAEIGKLKLLRHLNLDDCPLILELPEVPKRTVPSLRELASRVISRHSLPLPESLLPVEVIDHLKAPHGCCSFCNGPFYDHHIKRFRFVNKGPYLVALEYRLCSLHWTSEKDRILSIFRPTPLTAPSKLEPHQMDAIYLRILSQIRPKAVAILSQEQQQQLQDNKRSMDSNISILYPNSNLNNNAVAVVSNTSLHHLNLNNLSISLNPSPNPSPSSLSVDNISIKSSSKKVKQKGKLTITLLQGSSSSNQLTQGGNLDNSNNINNNNINNNNINNINNNTINNNNILPGALTPTGKLSQGGSGTGNVGDASKAGALTGMNKRRKASLTCSSNEIGGPSGSSSNHNSQFTQMEFIEESFKMKNSSSSLFKKKEHY